MDRKLIVKRIADVLREIAPDARRILYGSEARGEARLDSDIDILVILPDGDSKKAFVQRKFDIMDRMAEIWMDTGVDISTLVYAKSQWESHRTPFRVNVINEGIEL